MKISELISKLEELKATYGDRDVYMEYDSIAMDTLPTSWKDDADKVTGIIIK